MRRSNDKYAIPREKWKGSETCRICFISQEDFQVMALYIFLRALSFKIKSSSLVLVSEFLCALHFIYINLITVCEKSKDKMTVRTFSVGHPLALGSYFAKKRIWGRKGQRCWCRCRQVVSTVLNLHRFHLSLERICRQKPIGCLYSPCSPRISKGKIQNRDPTG
jgi:hypothetical protein